MSVARWIIVSFLILAMMVAASPQAWVATRLVWDHARPGVIEAMDDLYAVIRNFVAGSDPHEGIDDDAPGVDYDVIITMDPGDFQET